MCTTRLPEEHAAVQHGYETLTHHEMQDSKADGTAAGTIASGMLLGCFCGIYTAQWYARCTLVLSSRGFIDGVTCCPDSSA